MIITLSIIDLGGQKRFGGLFNGFLAGTAAVAVVFDLSRPETLFQLEDSFKEIRERAGNIPIVLVGNKDDLKKDIGEMIPRDKIIQIVNQFNLFEYIETSALQNKNVGKVFSRLATTAVFDLEHNPRLGEVVDANHFRFKVLVIGAAAVGKTSLIRAFVKKDFKPDYKITVGLDIETQDFEIPSENMPKELIEVINEGIAKIKAREEEMVKRAKLEEKVSAREVFEKKLVAQKVEDCEVVKPNHIVSYNRVYIALTAVGIAVLIVAIIHIFF